MSGLSRCKFAFASFSLKTQFVAMFAALLCLFALCPASLHAQAASSTSIAGIVTDSSGAFVIGATVKLTDKATNTPRSTATNDAGRYFFANVLSGDYEIAVSKTGFRITKTIVTANIGVPLTVDLKLELGSVSETVEVTATNSELQTMNSSVGNTITGASLDALPSIGGDVSTFVALQPGVASSHLGRGPRGRSGDLGITAWLDWLDAFGRQGLASARRDARNEARPRAQ